MDPLPIEDSSYTHQNEKAISSGMLINHKNEKLPVTNNQDSDLISKPSLKIENGVAHDERGIATWTHSSYDDGNFYALHTTAPQGTIITVRNLMNNKTVSVKVIGKLPSTSGNENILIKLSESAAKKLNVLDDKFLVEITYTASEEINSGGIN